MIHKNTNKNIYYNLQDKHGKFKYSITEGNGALVIDPESGWLKVANQTLLDREKTNVIRLQVCTTQVTPLSSHVLSNTTDLTIEVHAATVMTPLEEREFVSLSSSLDNHSEIDHKTAIKSTLSPQILDKMKAKSLPFGVINKPRNSELRKISVVNKTSFKSHPILLRKSNTKNILTDQDQTRKKRSSLRRQVIKKVLGRKVGARKLLKSRPFNSSLSRTDTKVEIGSLLANTLSNKSCTIVKLTLLDANDNNPQFLPSNHYEFTLPENSSPGDVIGSVSISHFY